MSKQTRKQQSEQWKQDNDWYLTQAEKSTKRMSSARERIQQMIDEGRDASLYIDAFNEAYPENKF